MPNTNMIQTNQLTKIIDGREIVKDISLHHQFTTFYKNKNTNPSFHCII